MILNTFLNIINISVSFLIGLLPDVVVNQTFINTISTVSTYVSALYSFIPTIITAVLAVLVIDLTFEGVYLLYKAIYWIIRRFPTQS